MKKLLFLISTITLLAGFIPISYAISLASTVDSTNQTVFTTLLPVNQDAAYTTYATGAAVSADLYGQLGDTYYQDIIP